MQNHDPSALANASLPLRFTNRVRRRPPHHRIRVSPGLDVESGQSGNVLRGRVAKRQRRERLAARSGGAADSAPSTAAADRGASDRSGSQSARAFGWPTAAAARMPRRNRRHRPTRRALTVPRSRRSDSRSSSRPRASVPSTANAAGSPVSGRSAVPSIESRPVFLSNVPRRDRRQIAGPAVHHRACDGAVLISSGDRAAPGRAGPRVRRSAAPSRRCASMGLTNPFSR